MRQSVIREERASTVTVGADVVPDIANGLGQIERAQVVADRQALAERFMHGDVEGAAQVALADQNGRPRDWWHPLHHCIQPEDPDSLPKNPAPNTVGPS